MNLFVRRHSELPMIPQIEQAAQTLYGVKRGKVFGKKYEKSKKAGEERR